MKTNLTNKILLISVSILLLILGCIGVTWQKLRPSGQFEWKIEQNQIVVTEIVPGGAAQKAGLKTGDRLLKLNDRLLIPEEEKELEFLIDGSKSDEILLFAVQRGEEKIQVYLILVSRYGKGFVILNLLLGLMFWAVGIFVYLNKSAEKGARVFFWTCMAISMSVMLFWEGHPYDPKIISYLLIITYFILYPLTPSFALYFCVVYPNEKSLLQRHRFLPALIFAPGLGFIILLEIFYLSAVHLDSLAYYRSFSFFYNLFRVFFIICLTMSIGCLIHSYKFSESRESRNKIQWILWGIWTGTFPFLFLWTLPPLLGFSNLIPEEINYIFLMIIPLAFGFSIVKYHALNIEIIVNRSIVYTLVTGVIVTLYLTLVGLSGYILHSMTPQTSAFLTILFTLIAAAFFSPLKQRVQNFVDRTFYRVKYNYQLARKDFSSALASVRDQIELINLIIEKINSAIPVEKIALMLKNPVKKIFEVSRSLKMIEKEKQDLKFEFSSHIVQAAESRRVILGKKNRVIFSDIVELPEEGVLYKIGIELVIPIMFEKELKGFLVLGKKMSDMKFSEEDLDLLIPMAEEGFVALERLRLQESMIMEQAEKEKLKELSELKSEFISHVSHELRTPLTSIRWSVENLLDGIPEKPSQNVKKYLAGIYDSSQHLSRMIENLLDVTKIEAGKIEIHTEKMLLIEEIEKSLTIMKPFAEKKNINLELNVDKNLWINTDRDCLQAVLTNLLDNAVKYSNKGGRILVRTEISEKDAVKKSDDKSKRMVAVSVIDNGMGIPKEKQKTVFERFERVKKTKAAREKGLGLGLHIVRKLVELQGGRIWVESEVGKGSVFTFTVPGD